MSKILIKNTNIIDGSKDENLKKQYDILIENEKIIKIDKNISEQSATIIDGTNKYLTPGLINLHLHLPASGKVGKKRLGDLGKLVTFIKSTALNREIGIKICYQSALSELYSGVTTLRTVGGVGTFDSTLRDRINKGKLIGPRLLVANEAIGVEGGHMDKTVSKAISTPEEAVELVNKLAKEKVDLIKLMITGGVLDGKEVGHPAPLKMDPKIVKAACKRAHELNLKVAAHIESGEGIKVGIENGVDSIEHGAKLDQNLLNILKEHNGMMVTTFSAAIPFVNIDPKTSPYGEIAKINSQVVLDGMSECAKKCLENGIKVGLGNDAGSSYVTHYNFYRELIYFKKILNVSNNFTIYSATYNNAMIAGIDDHVGLIKEGYDADLLLLESNPLDDLIAFKKPVTIIARGKLIKPKKIKHYENIDKLLDSIN